MSRLIQCHRQWNSILNTDSERGWFVFDDRNTSVEHYIIEYLFEVRESRFGAIFLDLNLREPNLKIMFFDEICTVAFLHKLP
jgi:hypothetical protein